MDKLHKEIHGLVACYMDGCRCELCKKAGREYHKEYYQRLYVIAKRALKKQMLLNAERKEEA